MIDRKKFSAVVTTHSGHLLHWLPNESVKFLRRAGVNCEAIIDPHPTSLEAVGIYLKPEIFIYVEDVAAQIIGRLLIERFDPVFARRCHLEQVGGESVITKALEASGINPFGLKFLGWYDGDQNGKTPELVHWCSTFLPGDRPIEVIFRTLASASPADAARALGNERVPEVLKNLEGQDAHDWSLALSKAIGRDHESVLANLLDLWLNVPEHLAQAEHSVRTLQELPRTR